MITNIIYYYCIFSISTGITSYFTLFSPILKELSKVELSTSQKFARGIILVSIASVVAPILFKKTLTGPDKKLLKYISDKQK